jgi:SAM-dependent methyltransferase
LQKTDTPYNKLVTTPEEIYLQSIAEEVVRKLPNEFEYIDLGPGTAGKEKYIFEAAKRQRKKIIYRPVDISKYYLDKSRKHAEEYGLVIKPLQCSFEELPEILGVNNSIPRVVSLGLTFSNFESQGILGLLKRIAGFGGFAFVNSQIRDRIDMNKLKEIYDADIKSISNDKIKFLGLKSDQVDNLIADDSVKVWITIKEVSENLRALGVQTGDKFLIFQSLRPTKESLINELERFGEKFDVFDVGDSFVGTLLNF